MPYEEIARALDMTVPATKSLLFRSRNMLKEALASFYPDNGALKTS